MENGRNSLGPAKYVCVLVAQLCPTLCDSTNWSPPGFSVRGNLHARILAWIAIPFSRGSSPPRDWTPVSCIAGRFFTIWAKYGGFKKIVPKIGAPRPPPNPQDKDEIKIQNNTPCLDTLNHSKGSLSKFDNDLKEKRSLWTF